MMLRMIFRRLNIWKTNHCRHMTVESTSLKIGPSVRKLLEEYAVSPSSVTATGPHHSLLKGDVLEHITTKQLSRVDLLALLTAQSDDVPPSKPSEAKTATHVSAVAPSTYTDVPISTIRSTIAKRMMLSKATTPHAYASIKCGVEDVESVRRRLLDDNIKVSLNDFIVKAAAMALERVPVVNTVWNGDDPVISPTIDVCVAVATDDGLLAPVVRNANRLGIVELSATIQDFASRMRAGQTTPTELQGGSFSISNLGMYGLSKFTAIINPPQTAILTIGSRHVTLDANSRPRCTLHANLSHDARVIDETSAATFLETFREFLQTPSLFISGLKFY